MNIIRNNIPVSITGSTTGTGQRGLTLIEIMVALTLSLLLLAGVIQIFLGNKVTYRMQEGLARLQENGRYAVQRMIRDVREAGYQGCVNTDEIVPDIIVKNPPTDLQFTSNDAVQGIDNVSNGNTWNAMTGTDVLVVRSASNTGVNIVGNYDPINANIQISSNPGWDSGDILFVTDCQHAHIFQVTNSPGTSPPVTVTHAANANNNPGFRITPAYSGSSMVMAFESLRFFVRDTGRTNSSGDPVISLYQQDVSGNVSELVEGIENMQITYGIDVDGNKTVDQYVTANAIPDPGGTYDWNNVVAVRLHLLINSVEPASSQARPYTFQGNTVTPADRLLRREFSTTISLRNRAS